MNVKIDYETYWVLCSIIQYVVEAVEEHCHKDDDGDYIVLIGNEYNAHVRTWIGPENLEILKKFISKDYLLDCIK